LQTAVADTDFVKQFQELDSALARTSVSIGLSIEDRLRSIEHRLDALSELNVADEEGLIARLKTIERALALQHNAVLQNLDAIRIDSELLLNRHVVPLSPKYIATRTPFGYVTVPSDDLQLVIYLCEGALSEPGVVQVFRALLQGGDTALDVGANVGTTTLALASATGPSGKVVSIEPSPSAAEALGTTVRINGLTDRVDIHQIAATDHEGPWRLYCGETSPLSSGWRFSQATDHLEVIGRPLDIVVPSGMTIALAKIDVEGAELMVLSGMRRILQENPDLAVIVEFAPSHLHRTNTSPQQWFQAFRDAGFDRCYQIEDPTGRCHAVESYETLAKVISVNLLMMRTGSKLCDRLTAATTSP
jgi:FkbM family methyltransferase